MLQTLFEAIIPQKRKDTTIFCFNVCQSARISLKKQLFCLHNRNVFYRKAGLLEHDLFNLHGDRILQYPFSNHNLCCIAADDHHAGTADLCVDEVFRISFQLDRLGKLPKLLCGGFYGF